MKKKLKGAFEELSLRLQTIYEYEVANANRVIALESKINKALPSSQCFAMVWGEADSILIDETPYPIGDIITKKLGGYKTVKIPIAFQPKWLRKGDYERLELKPMLPIKITKLRCNEPFVIRSILVGTRLQNVSMGGAMLEGFCTDIAEPGVVVFVDVEWPNEPA